jgi:hypothetical protein
MYRNICFYVHLSTLREPYARLFAQKRILISLIGKG